MDTLREIALREKVDGKDKKTPKFHKAFLLPIRYLGKQYELSLFVLLFLFRALDLRDIGLGIKMVMRNKLPFFPAKVKGLKQISS